MKQLYLRYIDKPMQVGSEHVDGKTDPGWWVFGITPVPNFIGRGSEDYAKRKVAELYPEPHEIKVW
jgi:hypothetical protein